MSEQQLRQLIEYASGFAEGVMAKDGYVASLWHCVKADGQQIVTPHPAGDKDLANAMMRAFFDLHDVVRYVYLGEAWTLLQPESEQAVNDWIAKHGSLKDHPRRKEVVQLMGEDSECGQHIWWREIIRPKNRKPYLGPLQTFQELHPGKPLESRGRMVGMLPVRGTKQ
jgi:hypothetical protein